MEMFICAQAAITENRKIAEGVFSLLVRAEEIASSVRPGQFVSVACGFPGALLRRPISVCGADGRFIRLVYETRGKGTQWLSQQAEGCELDIGGPQGNGFAIPDAGRVLLVGGGLGSAPLLFAAKELSNRADAVLGFRGAEQIVLLDEFRDNCGKVVLATDDGSAGLKGTVAQPLEAALTEGGYSTVLACGPRPMLKAVARMCLAAGVKCQVSLEERMACGMGACLVCVCETKCSDGTHAMSRVCRDGPVFDSSEVVW